MKTRLLLTSLLKKGYGHLATIIFPGSTGSRLGASPLFQQAVTVAFLAVSVQPGTTWGAKSDYLAKVRAYADAMIEHGRDTVGETTSPLLLISIDPQTMAIPNVGSPRGLVVARLPMSFRHCANPHLDQNLCQIMYALSEITDDVIANLIAAYRLTKCEKYLARAEHCADMAIEVFLSDGPLPKTIGKAADYCAASRCDTLMMQLLDLYLIRNRPEAHVKLIYTDR